MTAKQIAQAELVALNRIIDELNDVDTEALEKEISKAKRIFVGGAGRSLLSMKGFAMRLMQTGHETYLVGEVCTPSVQAGDLIIVGSGSGETKVTLDVVRKARSHGARAVVLTMHGESPIAQTCDRVIVIPGIPAVSTEDDEAAIFVKKNLVGNFFEASVTLVLDGIISALMVQNGQTGEVIRYNHANLE
ncbi:3-hexulose-6-phosphate isomerase [Firmicutes bacterium CAG:791]|nr:3-hexulose-6-phosphate isomerase [Firmicutes bacterium CAG:791]